MSLRIYGDLALQNQAALKLLDAASSYSVQLRAPSSLAADTTFQLPSSLGQNNQVMVTDSNGQFSFAFLADSNIASNAAISLSKLAALTVSKALVSDANGVVSTSNVTATEIGYLSGVTSSVQNQLNTEVGTRANADVMLQAHIDIEAAARAAADSQEASARAAADATEAAARAAADSQLSADLAQEASDRAAADSAIEANLSQEVSNRQAAVSQEASDRQAADATLQSNLDAETSARQAAVSSEQAAREAADAGLQSQIDNILSNVDPAALDSLTEVVAAFQAADSNLQDAISALGTGATSALSDEIARAQAAEAGLQSAIDSEISNRQSAISSEASTRQSADQTLQSNLDSEAATRASADTALGNRISALTVDDMTDVETSSKAAGDLMEWDATAGQWKNVAPISEAGSVTVTVPGTEELLFSTSHPAGGGTGRSLDYEPYVRGWTFTPVSQKTISKIEFELKLSTLSSNGNVFLRIRSSMGGPVVAESSQVALSSLSSSNYEFKTFSFNGETLAGGTTHYVDIVFTGTNAAIDFAYQYDAGSPFRFYWRHASNGGSEVSNMSTNARIYTGSAGSSSTTATVGVIKTNAQGQLDDSFLAHDVDFGGHKLSGVSGPASDTDAANKKYVDDQVAAEASARSSAVSSEASARAAAVSQEASDRASADATLQGHIDSEASDRQSADANLQSQIDSLSSGSSAGLAQEISDRQAADAVLQGNIDTEKARIDAILSASDADKDSFAEIVQLINSVDTENDSAFASYVLSNNAALAQEVSDRQAAVSSEQSARETADAAEQAAREAADTAIYTYIDGHKFKMDWTSGTSMTVTHNMGTKDVVVQVYDKSDGASLTMEMIRATDNSVTLTANREPGMSGWRVLVLKV